MGAPATFADASESNSLLRAIVFIRPIIVLTALAAFGAGAITRPACDPRKADSAVKSVQALNVLKTRMGIPTEQDIKRCHALGLGRVKTPTLAAHIG